MIDQALEAEGYVGAPLRVLQTGPRCFRLLGELDLSSAEPLSRFLDSELALPGDLTLDLRGLTFIDSAGLHLFIGAAAALGGRGGLRLLEPRRSVAKVIETTGLDRVANLEVVSSEDAQRGGTGPVVPVSPIDLS
ncbi:MAG TPA: STAS domain-containing protein [Actinomycetota bacterium]|nr:STAS domain-containing protein [Actinomycetota bacterium]